MTTKQDSTYRHVVDLNDDVELFKIDTENTDIDCRRELLLLQFHGEGESKALGPYAQREEYTFRTEQDGLLRLARDILHELEHPSQSSVLVLTPRQIERDLPHARPWTNQQIVAENGLLCVILVLHVEHAEGWTLPVTDESPYAFWGDREQLLNLAHDIQRVIPLPEDGEKE